MKRTVFLVLTVFLLAAGSLFAQGRLITIDATGKTVEQVIRDILLDWRDYDGMPIIIKNLRFVGFGIRPDTGYAYSPLASVSGSLANYFKSEETYRIVDYNTLTDRSVDPRFYFYFQPEDREGRRLMLDLSGKRLNSPVTVEILGAYYRRMFDSPHTYNTFFVAELTLNGTKYGGLTPREALR